MWSGTFVLPITSPAFCSSQTSTARRSASYWLVALNRDENAEYRLEPCVGRRVWAAIRAIAFCRPDFRLSTFASVRLRASVFFFLLNAALQWIVFAVESSAAAAAGHWTELMPLLYRRIYTMPS
jgi:hypothetical protein